MEHLNIKYYSNEDLAAGWELRRAEEILLAWDGNTDIEDINVILEFYNINCYFKSGARLSHWDDATYTSYKTACKNIPPMIGIFFSKISDQNIGNIYSKIYRAYKDDFWRLACKYKVVLRISNTVFESMLKNDIDVLWYVLHEKEIVSHFGQTIADCLCEHPKAAEWLMSHFLTKQKETFVFPNELTNDMRMQLLNAYIDSPNPHPNYLQLLAESQSSKEFPLSDRLRLKARKKWEQACEEHFSKHSGLKFGVQVSFRSCPAGNIEFSGEGNDFCVTYSREWIQENKDFPTLLNNFIHLFGYVDGSFRCLFTSQKTDQGILEQGIGIKGKKQYDTGIGFDFKSLLSTIQMQAYLRELEQIEIRIEDIFKWFFEEYLPAEFHALGFSYKPPSAGTTYAEKCKLLASAMEGVLKQYRLFVEDGFVDRELLEMSSEHIIFRDILSMRQKKYVYAVEGSKLNLEQHYLYSDQSMMTYTEKTESKYETLPQLLLNEDMTLDDFHHYQTGGLQWLIQRDVLFFDEKNYLRIKKPRAALLYQLYHKTTICTAYCNMELQQLIDELVASGELIYENTLFSRPEQDYLNYMLNKSKFSNGLDIRNKYIHDTYSLDEDTQFREYLELLKIMVLIIIKINEEFCKKQDMINS